MTYVNFNLNTERILSMTDKIGMFLTKNNFTAKVFFVIAAVMLTITWPFTIGALIFKSEFSSLLGLVGGPYYESGSDFYLYKKAFICIQNGQNYLDASCQANPFINATPGAILFTSILHFFLNDVVIYFLFCFSTMVFFIILPLENSYKNILFRILILFSPGFLLGLKSGNLEVFAMTSTLVSLIAISRQKHDLGLITLLFAILIKIYPIVLIPLLPKKHMRIASSITCLYIIIFAKLIIEGYLNTALGFENTFGLSYHLAIFNDLHWSAKIMDPILWLQNEIFIGLQNFLTRNSAYLLTTLTFTLIIIILAWRKEFSKSKLPNDLLSVGASLLSIIVIGFGWNWSYRYWVTFLFIPAILRIKSFKNKLLLVSIIIGAISQYRIAPPIFFINDAVWSAGFTFRHVLQHYSEIYIVIFSVQILKSYLVSKNFFTMISTNLRLRK